RARLPFRSRIAAAQASQFMPRFAAVFRLEDRGIFDASVNVIRIVERRFQVPHAFELPRVLGAVVPLMRGDRLTRPRRRVVNEFVSLAFWHAVRTLQFLGTAAGGLPSFAAVV